MKIIRIRKEEKKLPLFIDNTVVYIEKPRKQQIIRNNEVIKIAGYKIDIQK